MKIKDYSILIVEDEFIASEYLYQILDSFGVETIFKAKNSLHGTFLPIKNEKAKSLNERFAAYFEGEKGHKYAISIIAGEYEDAKDSDIVIITSGIARKPGQTRLELTQTNVNILKSITPEIVKAAPDALYLIVSNPVDIMTYVFTKISGSSKRSYRKA